MSKLPDKPSDLIEVALNDLIKVERSKKFLVNMNVWFSPDVIKSNDFGNRPCEVCFGGSVMAKTLNMSLDHDYGPEDFDYDVRHKLSALDAFRIGGWEFAFKELEIDKPVPKDLYSLEVPSYHENRGGFKRAMRKAVRILRKEGL